MWRTIDIVPSSIREDPQVQAACEAIDAELQQIYTEFLPESAASTGQPSICFWPFVMQQVPPLLDVLAWEMHVDVWAGWEGTLDLETKRRLIEESIHWHQHKGTRYAVDQMLATVFKQGVVTEWYEYGGRPYYFRIITEDEIVDPDQLLAVIDGIYAVKNVRSWLDEPGFIRSRRQQQTLYHTVVIREKLTTRIRMAETT
jgi:phage tail P2-like protein